MSDIVTKCSKCGHIGIAHSDGNMTHIWNNCNGKLIECNMSKEDLRTLERVINDNDFFQAMLDLKEKDIIEYGVKMAQFRTQVAQQEAARKAKSSTVPKCPHCNSTNIKPISGLAAAHPLLCGACSARKSIRALNAKAVAIHGNFGKALIPIHF